MRDQSMDEELVVSENVEFVTSYVVNGGLPGTQIRAAD